MKRAVILLAVVALAACDDMADQAKPKPSRAGDVRAIRGTVAREPVDPSAPPLDLALLRRGRERFDIYCAPCHGAVGDGDGMVVERGFPRPPSFHAERLRDAPTRHFYDVATEGYGAMYGYAARVAPRDRWAIAAYIRALQASQTARVEDVPPERRDSLQ